MYVFVDRCLSFCSFSFCHCVVCPSSIYILWLPFGICKLFLSFCSFPFGYCIVCPSSIYGFWLSLLVSSNFPFSGLYIYSKLSFQQVNLVWCNTNGQVFMKNVFQSKLNFDFSRYIPNINILVSLVWLSVSPGNLILLISLPPPSPFYCTCHWFCL